MKAKLLFFLMLLLGAGLLSLQAQDVSFKESAQIAANFAASRTTSALAPAEPLEVTDGQRCLARMYRLNPQGFLFVTADRRLDPVWGWSDQNNLDPADPHGRAILTFLRSDLNLRLLAYDKLATHEKARIATAWKNVEQQTRKDAKFQQWPAAGTTATGGWLETNWTQSSPYNAYCPMDLNAGNRSIAGCPAVAMAQVLNYLEVTNGTRFGSGDDYYHSYGSGNQYWIDNDSATRDFPGFGTLNFLMDSLDLLWTNKAGMSNSLKAALVFACGTACEQVYTASGSGTFGIDQAADAYQRFGFTASRLVFDTDTALNSDLADNIKNGLCAHLGLVDSAVTVGHNVVVDGYNTDEFYHFNFGWGGSYNGWYTMPPASMPYSLTVIEGIVLDIMADSSTASLQKPPATAACRFYPNPAAESFRIVFDGTRDSVKLTVFDGTGRPVCENSYQRTALIEMNLAGWSVGAYIVRIDDGSGRPQTVKFIKQ
jgi:hypothetical protein